MVKRNSCVHVLIVTADKSNDVLLMKTLKDLQVNFIKHPVKKLQFSFFTHVYDKKHIHLCNTCNIVLLTNSYNVLLF